MKALVLGATGFIGSHIARQLLKEKIEVRILRRSTSPALALEGLKVESFVGDLADRDSLSRAMAGCEALFHAAGYYPIYSLDRERQKKLAMQQMHNVLQVAEETPSLKRVVYTSSLSTIGKAAHGLADENTPYDPNKAHGLYYEIKYLLEQEALNAAHRGLPLIVMNPTGCFGDYDVKPTSGIFIVQIAKGNLPFLFDAKMNEVDAQDVAEAQVAAIEKGRIGERYILGGHNLQVWEFGRLVAGRAGVRPPMIKLPLFVGKAAAFSSEIFGKYFLHQGKPMIPLVGMEFLEHGMHYDCTKAQRELGLKTTPLEETVDRALDWFRKHGYI